MMWARRYKLCASDAAFVHLGRSGIARLVARGFPSGTLDGLQIAADWTTLFCLIDDRTEAAGMNMVRLAELLSDLMRAYAGHVRRGSDGYARALADLGTRMRAAGRPEWVERFGVILEKLFSAFLWENLNRHSGIRPSLNAYLIMREQTVGLHPQLALGELTDGITLTAEERARPEVVRIARMVCRLIGWVNDIFTVDKEEAQGEVHNLVLVLQDDCGMSRAEALHAAVQQHNEEMRAYVAVDEGLRAAAPSADLLHWLDVGRAWIGGHLDWARETARYRGDAAAAHRVGNA